MYFKVTRKMLKKALVFLKKQDNKVKVFTSTLLPNGETVKRIEVVDNLNKLTYVKQIEFALYKTKLEEFYIDFDFAEAIRPALLTKEYKEKK